MLEPRTEPDQTTRNPIFDPNWRSGGFGSRARKAAENYRNFSSEGIEFHPGESGSGSGIHSPPLWQSSSPPGSPSHRNASYRSLSPASRTQAIARGQRELMEMVKSMPETSYELSLKDLVEHHNSHNHQHQHVPTRMGSPKEESCLLENKSYDDGDDRRRESGEDEDVFVKMTVFPVSFKSMKTLTKKKSSSSYSAVSPAVTSTKLEVTTLDKDQWWKKRFSGSSGSESGVTNSSSNPSGSTGSSGSNSSIHSHGGRPASRKRIGLFRSCLSCFYSPNGNYGD